MAPWYVASCQSGCLEGQDLYNTGKIVSLLVIAQHKVVHWVTIAVWTFADKAYMKWIVIVEDLQGETAGCRPADITSVSCLPSLENTPLVAQSFHQEWSIPSC
jgi:hypothetical protein